MLKYANELFDSNEEGVIILDKSYGLWILELTGITLLQKK